MTERKPINGLKVTREELEQLDPLHRIAADAAIRRGAWILVPSLDEAAMSEG